MKQFKIMIFTLCLGFIIHLTVCSLLSIQMQIEKINIQLSMSDIIIVFIPIIIFSYLAALKVYEKNKD